MCQVPYKKMSIDSQIKVWPGWLSSWLQHNVSRSENIRLVELFFADDVVLLASSESGPQHELNGFAAACDIARMTISGSKTDVLRYSRISF